MISQRAQPQGQGGVMTGVRKLGLVEKPVRLVHWPERHFCILPVLTLGLPTGRRGVETNDSLGVGIPGGIGVRLPNQPAGFGLKGGFLEQLSPSGLQRAFPRISFTSRKLKGEAYPSGVACDYPQVAD